MSYVIHYFAGAVYDGADILETEYEYYQTREMRKGEGWTRVGAYTSGDDQVLVMQMGVRA